MGHSKKKKKKTSQTPKKTLESKRKSYLNLLPSGLPFVPSLQASLHHNDPAGQEGTRVWEISRQGILRGETEKTQFRQTARTIWPGDERSSRRIINTWSPDSWCGDRRDSFELTWLGHVHKTTDEKAGLRAGGTKNLESWSVDRIPLPGIGPLEL